MQHFISEVNQSKMVPMTNFKRRAEAIYDENLNSYVKIVIRRPFSKIIVSVQFCITENYVSPDLLGFL